MSYMKPVATQVHLHRYTPLWAILFWLEKVRLRLILPGRVLGIAHVGSTAIRGTPAKPVIDISVAVPDYAGAWEQVRALQAGGYLYRGENSNLREYSFEKYTPYACALFLCEPGGEKWRERLRFRDYLRSNPPARRAYAVLKRRLAEECDGDLMAYQRRKLPFVLEICAWSGDLNFKGGIHEHPSQFSNGRR